MSYNLRVIYDSPDGFWEGITDLSGRGNDASLSGSPADYANLVAGQGGSKVITSTAEISYPNRVFTEDRGIKPFSLEAWVKPLLNANPASILGHNDASGLVVEDNTIKFIIPFVNESVETSYTFISPEVYHVVGTTDGFGMRLYINGELVDAADIDEEHREAGYDLSTDDLIAGTSSATGSLFIIDSPAVYGYALGQDQIADHYKWGRNVRIVRDVVSQRDGLYHRFIDEDAGVYAARVFNTVDEWSAYYSEGVVISDEGVFPDDTIDTILTEGFEVGLTGWTPWPVTVDIEQSEDQARSENHSAKITPDGASGTASINLTAAIAPAVVPGQKIRETAWAYSPTGYNNVRLQVDWLDSGSSYLSTSTGTTHNLEQDTWTELSNVFTAPANAAFVVARVGMGGTPSASDVLYVDDVELEDLTRSGFIEVAVPLLEDDQIYGARIDWIGEGSFTVETSVDHDVYTPAVNHGIIDGSYIATVVDEALAVRITFDGSVLDGPAAINYLSVVAYSSDVVEADRNSRDAIVDENVVLGSEENQPIEFNDLFGATIANTSIVIDPDEQVAVSEDPDGEGEGIEDPDEINAIELWVRFNLLSGDFYLVDTRDSTNTTYPRIRWQSGAMAQTNFTRVYVNGERVATIGSYTFQTGVWYHIVLTYSAGFNPTITIGREYNGSNSANADFQLGHLAAYTDFPIFGSTPDPTGQDLLNEYLGIPQEIADDESVVEISEPADPVRAYAYDWAISPAG